MVEGSKGADKPDPLSYGDTIIKLLPAGAAAGEPPVAMTSSEAAFLTGFLPPAFSDIRHPVTSAWTEHLPFMFCLMRALRPRRYVELGAHYGASFFAACQAARELDMDMECIALDTWEGDPHAGLYGKEVFDQFTSRLRADFAQVGRYIRKDFDSAAGQFEQGSIDLLHIDGMHTYEAVKNDFETWLPKLSTRGAILFHDTHEREKDFGVYRLWDEVRVKYPSFYFEHGHGLGLIYVGTEQGSREAAFLGALQREDLAGFFRKFFSLQGGAVSKISAKDLALAEKDFMLAKKEELILQKADLLRGLEATVAQKDFDLAQKEAALTAMAAVIANREEAIAERDKMLLDIHSSTGFKMLARLYRVREALFPPSSLRGKLYSFLLKKEAKRFEAGR